MRAKKTLKIDWQIQRSLNGNERGHYVSEQKYAKGWRILCFWGTFSFPRCIEIRQKRKREFAVGGHLELFRDDTRIFKKKIRSKIVEIDDSTFTFISINVDDSNQIPRQSSVRSNFFLKGRLDIASIKMVSASVSRDIKLKDQKMTFLSELSTDFEQLLDAQTGTATADVTLKCGDVSIPAHKIILCARSPVFAAMFSSTMIESRENDVVVTDIDETILRAMVRFMYTGQPIADLTVPLASDLMMAADKYQVNSLKKTCCDFLMKSVSNDNVLLLLDLGDAVDKDLKLCALSYICQSTELSDLQSTEHWKSLEKKKPVLALEILGNLVKSRDEKIKQLEELSQQE